MNSDSPLGSSNGAPAFQPVLPGHGDDVDVRVLWNFLLRNRLLIGLSFALGVIGAGVITWRMTPVYASSVSLRIEDKGDPLSPIEVLPELSSASLAVETEMGVLRSRTLVEDVVDSLELMLRVNRPRGAPRSSLVEAVHFERWAPPETYDLSPVDDRTFAMRAKRAGTVDTVAVGDAIVVPGGTFRLLPAAAAEKQLRLEVQSYPKAVQRVAEALEVSRPDRTASIVKVDFRSPDTILVVRAPNLMARRYIQRRLESQQTTASSTVRFLHGQLDSLALELTHAEDQIQAYREGQQVVSLQAEASAQVQQLARLQADRNALDAERGALQQLLDGINRETANRPVRKGEPSPYRRLIAFPSLLQNQAASQILQTLNTIENQRSELLRRRTMEDPDVQSLTARIEELEDQLRSIAVTYLQGLGNQVTSMDRTLGRFQSELSTIPAKELAVARLERQAETLRQIFMLLQTKLKESEIAQAAEDPSVRVLDAAVVNPEPVSPRSVLNVLLGALLGLMLGTAFAAGRDFLDRTVHTREDLDEASGGLPILGIIPQLDAPPSTNGKEKNGRPAERGSPVLDARLVTLHATKSAATEAYRAVRTSLRFSRLGEAPKTVVVTSALPQDGKSTTAANLAITLAQQGTRTLLIDADLRKGVIGKLFGHSSRPGLSNVLVGDAGSRDAFRQIEVGPGAFLHVLPTGAFPPNPAELVASDRMIGMLRKLEERYDAIIVDSPPLNLVTDASILGVHAGGVILVARASVTDKGALRYASDVLRSVRASVLGVILNGVDQDRDGRYYGSYYGAYYGAYRGYYGSEGEGQAKRTEKVPV